MPKVIKLKRGLNIRLKGKAEKILTKTDLAEQYAVKPPDFQNLTPKLTVKENDTVKAGDPLFFDKYNPDIKFTAPVSGTVTAIRRGERRRIMEVVIKPDSQIDYCDFGKADPKDLSREAVIEKITSSGCWPFIRQRPYAIIAKPDDQPKAIFISGFDSAPLAPDYDFLLQEESKAFQTGIDALKQLTNGKIHLGVNAEYPTSPVYEKTQGIDIHLFRGKHPAGNVGIQLHHIDPVNKGEVVWTINPLDVVIIGRLFLEGRFNAERIIALTGSEILKPRYFRTILGANIKQFVDNNTTDKALRYISGNVLTGRQISPNGYLGFYDVHLTVIPEGNYHEFFGWIAPGFKKFSMSRTFFSWLMPDKRYQLDTNLHGGHRAFIITGQYDKVLPMDILPVHLLKAIMIGDIELMENLGIYEIAEEDMALCEFVCTSKTEVQNIIRQGLNLMIKEMG